MNERIAVIDDSRDAAVTLAEYFKPYGVNVVVYTSCEEVLASGITFHAVVTDTDLGQGMSGFECARNIRGLFPDTVIVGTSVIEPEKNDAYEQLYRRSGANDFVNKRESWGTIARRVMDLLAGR